MSAGIGNLKQREVGGVWGRRKGRQRLAGGIAWKEGELEFEALMRMLDNRV